MANEKQFIRHCILYEFHHGKSATKACESICEVLGEGTVSKSTCQFWFKRFKQGDFDVSDRERTGAPLKVDDEELNALLAGNSGQTQMQLAEKLGVAQKTISNRLRRGCAVDSGGKKRPAKYK